MYDGLPFGPGGSTPQLHQKDYWIGFADLFLLPLMIKLQHIDQYS